MSPSDNNHLYQELTSLGIVLTTSACSSRSTDPAGLHAAVNVLFVILLSTGTSYITRLLSWLSSYLSSPPLRRDIVGQSPRDSCTGEVILCVVGLELGSISTSTARTLILTLEAVIPHHSGSLLSSLVIYVMFMSMSLQNQYYLCLLSRIKIFAASLLRCLLRVNTG